ncbi:hypothetical protein AAE478_002071 [Parahypoxylon ruwenzoriense]
MSSPSHDPIFFWKPSEPDAGFLSQWYDEQPFLDRTSLTSSPNGKTYATAEHYMMHHKALLFGDVAAAAAILHADTPREVRALGRAVRNFDDAVWARERERIVREGTWCKFSLPAAGSSSPEHGRRLRDALLATGARLLVEASPFDRIWGVGFGAAKAPRNRRKWGLNLLGKCLMDVREELRHEKEENEKGNGKEDTDEASESKAQKKGGKT